MSPLRQKMIEDMCMAGLSGGTQKAYIGAIARLAKTFGQSPDQLGEEQVATYLRDMIGKDGAARGTFQVAHYAIQFLYGNTLQRDWKLLKKRCVCRGKNVCRWLCLRTVRAVC